MKLAILAVALVGCASVRPALHTVLDVLQTTCILTHADTSDEEAIRKTCAISDALGPELHNLIGAHKEAVAAQRKAGTLKCP